MSVAAPRFYFEDVVLQGILETPAITVTEAHVALYGGLTADAALLSHCRAGGEHVRGCWVIDLLLARD